MSGITSGYKLGVVAALSFCVMILQSALIEASAPAEGKLR